MNDQMQGIPEEFVEAAQEACGLLKALGNLDRLLVLCHLGDGERNVSQLQEMLAVRQPTLSQQLAKLRLNGLVTTRRDGKEIYYRVASPQARRLIALLYEMYCPDITEAPEQAPAPKDERAAG